MQKLLPEEQEKISLSLIKKTLFVLFCGLPFANFFLQKVDIWHSQGYFFQFGALVLYCLHIFRKNKELSIFLFWSGLTTFCWFISFQIRNNQYAAKLFFPFFNLLCMVIFYDLLTKYLDKKIAFKLFKTISIVTLIVMIYCIFQILNLDQFYKPSGSETKKEIVGIIGNPMHLAHYLAISIPFFFALKPIYAKTLVSLALLVIFFTGSVSGIAVAISIIAYCLYFKRIFKVKELILTGLIGSNLLVWKFHNLHNLIKDFTFSSGRINLWKFFYPMFQKQCYTGWGLGIVNEVAKVPQAAGWRHLHFELYHFGIELGLIGVGIIIWGIIAYYKKFIRSQKDDTAIISVGVFTAFFLCSFFGFPAHLWLLSSLGMFGYAGLYLEE